MPRWTHETLTFKKAAMSGFYAWVVTSFLVIENRTALVIQRLGAVRFKYIINPGTLVKSAFQQFLSTVKYSGKKNMLNIITGLV